MKQIGWLISRYLVTTIIPYFVFSWLLLSVILFVQQAGRFSDIFFSVNVPTSLIWQLSVAIIPNVISFTCPMAMLVGTIIGLTKMQGDSELVAIRASGVGNLQVMIPIMFVGFLMSVFAFFVNSQGVPFAARLVRNIALQSAIKKLESPLEPGVFNSEISGFTIFVRGGDIETGRWKNVFIHNSDSGNNILRLITSKEGRIDTTGEVSELVLDNASVTTLPAEPGAGRYVTENIGELRLAIRTSRSELIKKLGRSELTPEELGLGQLSDYAANKEGTERVEAQILQNRRVILSISPLIFCLLGSVIVLRLNRGGRNFGAVLALIVLIGYYLLAFLGEQMARTGAISPLIGSLVPVVGSLAVVLWFSLSRRLSIFGGLTGFFSSGLTDWWKAKPKLQLRNLFVDVTTGLRDFDIIRNLIKNLIVTVCFLAAIFMIFTAFELWKFAGTIDGGVVLLAKYLTYLLPFMYLQVAPSAAMIATLATYVVKSRQNEIVTWTSAGQSVYRLLLPCFLLMTLLGGMNWLLQEYVLPQANQMQDAMRTRLRNKGVETQETGKHWVGTDKRIYSFNLEPSSSASDNGMREGCSKGCVRNLNVYELADNGVELQTVYRADSGVWGGRNVEMTGPVEKSDIKEGKIDSSFENSVMLAELSDPFSEVRKKPAHLDSLELKQQIVSADSELDRRSLMVGLEKKRSTLFLPLVVALFTAPFSLSLSRRGKAATIGYAIALWLVFMGASSICEQFGLNGLLSPTLAVWSPLALFGLFGIYLLTKIRT